jgi:hypothetical protein
MQKLRTRKPKEPKKQKQKKTKISNNIAEYNKGNEWDRITKKSCSAG